MDPCQTYVREAKKNLGLFNKNYWTAGLFFLNAAECYKNTGNEKKALEYAIVAVKTLEKYWNRTNDMVLPDLEKALSLAFLLEKNKKKKEELKKKAYKIYMHHARKLELGSNYLGASEKYESAIQFAPTGEAAKDALVKAMAVLEKALENPNVVKKKALREKIESRLDYLRSLMPEEKEGVGAAVKEEVTSRYSLEVEAIFYSMALDESIKNIEDGFPYKVTDVSIDMKNASGEVMFSIPGHSAFTKIICNKGLCTLSIFSSNLSFIIEIWGATRYYFDRSGAIKEVIRLTFKGDINDKQILGFLNLMIKHVKAGWEARKVSSYLKAFLDVLGDYKKIKKFRDKLAEYLENLESSYTFETPLLPVDSKKLSEILTEIKLDLGD